ncbi:uncharacterized protein LOC108049684 isoform X2 [Drosophila rhopaloa]|nr:uncharacterized protein LOC108049684 isoform X2 [Drosophila rhopaloa]
MNELTRTIHSALSMDKSNRVVVAGQNTQDNYLRALTKPQKQNTYSKCFSKLFIPERIPDRNVPHLSLKASPSLMQRTLSFDDLAHIKRLHSSEPLLWRTHSEGALGTKPGIYKQNCTQSDDDRYDLSSNADCMVNVGQKCSCRYTANCVEMDSNDDFEVFNDSLQNRTFEVIEASQLTPTMSQELFTEEQPENSSMCYWITLAHLLIVIAGIRGLL